MLLAENSLLQKRNQSKEEKLEKQQLIIELKHLPIIILNHLPIIKLLLREKLLKLSSRI